MTRRWRDKRDWQLGDACYASTRPIDERQHDVFALPKYSFGTITFIVRYKDGYVSLTWQTKEGIRSTVDSRHLGRGNNPNDVTGFPHVEGLKNGKERKARSRAVGNRTDQRNVAGQ